MKAYTTLAIFFAFLLSAVPLTASHFMGFEFSYEHLGGCTYRIYQVIYTDCTLGTTPFPAPPIPATPTNTMPVGYISFSGAGCTIPSITPNWVLYDAERSK